MKIHLCSQKLRMNIYVLFRRIIITYQKRFFFKLIRGLWLGILAIANVNLLHGNNTMSLEVFETCSSSWKQLYNTLSLLFQLKCRCRSLAVTLTTLALSLTFLTAFCTISVSSLLLEHTQVGLYNTMVDLII